MGAILLEFVSPTSYEERTRNSVAADDLIGQWFPTFFSGDPIRELLVITATPVAPCTICNLCIVYYLL